jgi:putative flippase GtrA
MVAAMDWRGSRSSGLIALGFSLARRGATSAFALGLTALCIVGFSGMAVAFAHHGKLDALPDVPLLASSALAYGVGVLVAFAASTRAFRRDEDDGVRALLRARGVSATQYLAARVVGLALSLAAFVAGGSFIVGLVAVAVSHGRATALHTLQAPVAMATLAARTRGRGYLVLFTVLVLPELLQSSLLRVIGPDWVAVCSVPGALVALRTALAPIGVDGPMLARSLVALISIVVAALLVVRVELARAPQTPRVERARLS